tara:strand:+ start:225 stop:437 length:213 start_codon:yes stop_codon:yes gene_type:complete
VETSVKDVALRKGMYAIVVGIRLIFMFTTLKVSQSASSVDLILVIVKSCVPSAITLGITEKVGENGGTPK